MPGTMGKKSTGGAMGTGAPPGLPLAPGAGGGGGGVGASSSCLLLRHAWMSQNSPVQPTRHTQRPLTKAAAPGPRTQRASRGSTAPPSHVVASIALQPNEAAAQNLFLVHTQPARCLHSAHDAVAPHGSSVSHWSFDSTTSCSKHAGSGAGAVGATGTAPGTVGAGGGAGATSGACGASNWNTESAASQKPWRHAHLRSAVQSRHDARWKQLVSAAHWLEHVLAAVVGAGGGGSRPVLCVGASGGALAPVGGGGDGVGANSCE
mmetsp:Transcript_53548/g.131160  ORF Transcript_53548/g.131160 Transcript_53548/m.131160 type:complete len:263 (-) Transcript_53548:621-1409(-)